MPTKKPDDTVAYVVVGGSITACAPDDKDRILAIPGAREPSLSEVAEFLGISAPETPRIDAQDAPEAPVTVDEKAK